MSELFDGGGAVPLNREYCKNSGFILPGQPPFQFARLGQHESSRQHVFLFFLIGERGGCGSFWRVRKQKPWRMTLPDNMHFFWSLCDVEHENFEILSMQPYSPFAEDLF